MPRGLPELRVVTSETTKTHCPYCAFQCGMTITAHQADERRLSVQADPDFPVNRGQMCIKGFTAGELLEHPGRLRSPKLRGRDGRLAPVSWESALDFIAERLQSLRARYGAATLGAFGSGALTNEKACLL